MANAPLIYQGNNAKFLKSALAIPGSTSGTLTIQPSATTTSHTLTMPAAQGGSNTYLKNDGSGGLSWATVSSASTLNVTSVSANYTVQAGDDLIVCNPNIAGITITLPAASSNSGRVLRFKRVVSVGNDFSVVTITPNGSDTIDNQSNTTLDTLDEEIVIVSNGSAIWYVQSRYYYDQWIGFTPTVNGVTTNPTIGTTTLNQGYYRRVGDSMEIRYDIVQTAAGTSGSGIYLFRIPNSSAWTIDTAKTPTREDNGLNASATGNGMFFDSNAGTGIGGSYVYNNVSVAAFAVVSPTGSTTSFQPIGQGTYCDFANTSVSISFTALVPIVGWK